MRNFALVVFLLSVAVPEPCRSTELPLFPSDISPREFIEHVRQKFHFLQGVRRELEFQRLSGGGDGLSDETQGHRGASRRLSQTSKCATLESDLVGLAQQCEHVFQKLDCYGPNLLDGVCENKCITAVLDKHAEFNRAGCTTSYSMDVTSRDPQARTPPSPQSSPGAECTFDRDCCPDEKCTDQKCVIVPNFCGAQVCMRPFGGMTNSLTLENELLIGEVLCSRTDETGAYCASQFLQADDATCVKARSLGCCVYTMEFFSQTCGFNSTLNANFTTMRTSCGLPATVCSNVNADVTESCRVTAADGNGATGGVGASWNAAVLASAWLILMLILG